MRVWEEKSSLEGLSDLELEPHHTHFVIVGDTTDESNGAEVGSYANLMAATNKEDLLTHSTDRFSSPFFYQSFFWLCLARVLLFPAISGRTSYGTVCFTIGKKKESQLPPSLSTEAQKLCTPHLVLFEKVRTSVTPTAPPPPRAQLLVPVTQSVFQVSPSLSGQARGEQVRWPWGIARVQIGSWGRHHNISHALATRSGCSLGLLLPLHQTKGPVCHT